MLRIICLPLQNIYDVITPQITPPHVRHDVHYQVLRLIAVQGFCMQSPSNSNLDKSRPSGTSVSVVESFCNLEQTKHSKWLNDKKGIGQRSFTRSRFRRDFGWISYIATMPSWLTCITVTITPQANITPVLKDNYLRMSGVHILRIYKPKQKMSSFSVWTDVDIAK